MQYLYYPMFYLQVQEDIENKDLIGRMKQLEQLSTR